MRRFAFLLFGIVSLAHAHTRVTYELKGEQLVIEGTDGFSTTVNVGCRGISAFENEQKVYVACGGEGIAIVSMSDPEHPELESRIATTEPALSFFLVSGDVWVQMQGQVARPISAAGSPLPKTKTKTKAKPGATFQVPDEATPRTQRLGGVNESCRDDSDCEGHLRCVEQACKRIEEGTRLTRFEIYGVERHPGFSGSLSAYAWIPGATAGFGMLLDASATYRFSFPMAVHVDLWPLGLTWADLGNILGTSFAGIITLDTQFLEIGLGPGVQTLNDRDGPQPAGLVSMYLRLGSADGLSFWFRPDVCFVSHRNTSSWDFGSFSGGIQMPLSERWALVLRGGGGNGGWGRGEVGTRFRLTGDGKHRTVFLTLGVGGAAAFLSANSVLYGGPALGGGIEWRP